MAVGVALRVNHSAQLDSMDAARKMLLTNLGMCRLRALHLRQLHLLRLAMLVLNLSCAHHALALILSHHGISPSCAQACSHAEQSLILKESPMMTFSLLDWMDQVFHHPEADQQTAGPDI